MVEIVISVVGEVAAKVAGCLLDPITRPLGYLFNYRRNITDLNHQIDSLNLVKERLQILVAEANRRRDEIFPDVQEWLKYAEGIIQEREDFNEDEKKASKSCFYFKSRYQLSEQAKTRAGEIDDKIKQAHNFGGRVSYRPPPPPPHPFMSSVSSKDCEAFQSRTSTFNQIMEALRNEDMSVIGVWGMGGVGKTTLVKQVAQKAEEDKLFHKVVMALSISPTPNISEIQGKIASMLGLKFEEEEDRAGRLRQRLKKEEKILVILDDIWEKLELGDIGIPYGDDHKGCKVLLTSRERQVLTKDMRTQTEFHLQQLSEEEAWNLFRKTAGDSVEKLELQPIAVDIAKKCEGLPVAIVTIANALRDERVGVWRNALEELRSSEPTNIRGVSKNVYSCLELSYNHLKSHEVKSLFLLCGLLGDGDIFMDHLLQYAMGLNLFQGLFSWEKVADKLTTLVENLKASSLLLEDEDTDYYSYSSLIFDHAIVRMHDIVRHVARSIASKDPHRFVVREAVGSQEAVELREWQRTIQCRNCTRISLICRNMDELAQGLVCPQLEFFLLNSSNYLKIPDAFFQDTKQLRVLGLSEVSLSPSPSSLGFLSNLRTLCLNQCRIQDIAVIGELEGLQVLSLARSNIKQLPKEMKQLSDLRVLDLRFCNVLEDIAVIGELKGLQVLILAESGIEQLPKEIMQLSDLRVLDLRNCDELKVIPRNVISSLSRLEYLSMEGSSDIEWESEGFNTEERINACLSELKHLSGLRTLEVEVCDPSLLPEVDGLFDDLNLTRYSIEIASGWDLEIEKDDRYKASRRMILEGVKSLPMVNCFSKLLKTCQVLWLSSLNDTTSVVHELDKEGFVELKYLYISACPTIQYILHSTSVELVPPRNSFPFPILEELCLSELSNLEALCHGPIPMGSFGNLRILQLGSCERLKYVFSLPAQNGRESAFPRLQSLKLRNLRDLISFYSTESTDTQEQSVTFFNQQAAFPALESLLVESLLNVRALWHNQFLPHSFSKLKRVGVSGCHKLLNVFPLSMVKAVVQLEELGVGDCKALEAIVANENEDEDKAAPLLGELSNLEAVCHGPIPMRSFGNLRILKLRICERLKYVFSLPTQNGRESAFPRLQSLELSNLPELNSFYSTESSDTQESVTFFNQQAVFPALESLLVQSLLNVRALWHNPLLPHSFSKLKRVDVSGCHKLLNVFPLSTVKALVQLEDLRVEYCPVLEAIVANENEDEDKTAPLLGELSNLEAVCHGPIPMCERLKYVSSLPTQNGRESAFPRLQTLKLSNLPEVISFYSTESSDTQESVTFFNQQAAFPALESLLVESLLNVRALWHNQFLPHSFSKLKRVGVFGCHKLLNVFPLSMVKALVQLEELGAGDCKALEAIVANENEDEEKAAPLLGELSNLEAVCHGPILMGSFGNLRILALSGCERLKSLISLPTQNGRESAFPRLEYLELSDLREVISFYSTESSDTQESVAFFNQQAAFSSLESLSLEHLDNVRALWHNQLSEDSFSKLKKLSIDSCNKLLNVFPPSMAKGLVQLKTLIIRRCHMMNEIVENEGDEPSDNDEIDFRGLESLELDGLPNLKCFCSARYTFQFPSLEEIKVSECPKMDFFCNGVLDAPRLKAVQTGYEFPQRYWEGDLNTTIHKMFMKQIGESSRARSTPINEIVESVCDGGI